MCFPSFADSCECLDLCWFPKQIETDGSDLSGKGRKGKINGTKVAPFKDSFVLMAQL